LQNLVMIFVFMVEFRVKYFLFPPLLKNALVIFYLTLLLILCFEIPKTPFR